MAAELVVTPGGYRPSDMVHKIGADLRLRILTGRLQGVNASDEPVADYGSVPRDGANPAMTPGYALPPGVDTPEGSEPVTPLGRGWIAFAHWTNEDNEHVSSFRSTWTVPPEPATRSGQTIFLFVAMQDTIPMTLLPALQWGPSAAGGGDYWSVASWYVGGTTGAVFHGELVPVNVGDELTGVISLVGRQRAHCDYRCGFEGLANADLPVFKVRDLSRCGEVLAAYGIQQCSDYPDESAMGFRNIELMKGFRRPALAWQPVNTVTECGQHVVILSDANPGGEVDVHFRSMEAQPEPEPAAAEMTTPAETEAVPLVAAAVEEAPELELATDAVAAEAVSEEGAIAPSLPRHRKTYRRQSKSRWWRKRRPKPAWTSRWARPGHSLPRSKRTRARGSAGNGVRGGGEPARAGGRQPEPGDSRGDPSDTGTGADDRSGGAGGGAAGADRRRPWNRRRHNLRSRSNC